MKKSTKILLKTTSILSIIISLVFLFHGACLMFNIGGYKDTYIDLMIKMGMVTSQSEVNFQVYMGIFDAIVSVLLNSYASGVYFKLSRANNMLLGTSKVILYVGILQCFFIISAIPGILAIIVSVILKKQEAQIVLRPRNFENKEVSSLDDLSDRIANLKARRDSGKISEEEYNHLLGVIIEDSAKENVSKGQLQLEKVSLKDRIIDIKQEENNAITSQNKEEKAERDNSSNMDEKKDN